MGDDGFGFHDETKLVSLSRGLEFSIFCGLVPSHHRLTGRLKTMEPFHVQYGFPTRKDQPHGITIFRTDSLAVLIQRDQGVIESFLERNADVHGRRIGAFGDQPAGLG